MLLDTFIFYKSIDTNFHVEKMLRDAIAKLCSELTLMKGKRVNDSQHRCWL